ncbi:EAL domain-containing protein [Pseudohongiella sp. O18]|uniref:EAL domain-containing protein n=1 Tax=Pseudohongiella sp. O18 TaxID=2904248 RepID=UPI001F23FC76|nr:EAL domain-containing protein [Pseudohongiella sp. O18]
MNSQFDDELAILRERYRRNLLNYRSEIEQHWSSLQQDRRSVHLEQLAMLAHRLAGSGRAYGFEKLSQLARSLEHTIDHQEKPASDDLLTQLTEPVNQLLARLRLDESDQDSATEPHTSTSDLTSPDYNPDEVRILVVDDDTDFCLKLCHFLRNHGYTVFSLNDIAGFEDAVARFSPKAVIVDMDFYGQRKAGAQTVLSWHERSGKPVPVIFVSAFDSMDLRLAAVRAGGNFFLSKPLDQHRLLFILGSELDLQPADAFRVLLVDDDADLLILYESILTRSGYAVHTASCATEALNLLEQESVDLVLIDVYMPEFNGIELGQLIRQHERFAHISLLFMSASADTDVRLACARLTSDEFINKPIEPWRLNMVIKARSTRKHNHLTRSYINYDQHWQQYDQLTALPSLKTFRKALQLRLETLNPSEHFAVLKIDIRHFHTVNNLYGYFTGNQVLQRLAWELSQSLTLDDLLCRESGDEFLVMTAVTTDPSTIDTLAKKLAVETSKPMQFDDQRTVLLSADIGVVVAPKDTNNADELLQYLDTALFAARRSTETSICYFDTSMRHREVLTFGLAQEVKRGLKDGQFIAVYQPIFSVADGKLTGFEALARWQHPVRGLVSPLEFIPVLEEHGLITQLTKSMLELALAQLATWRVKHPDLYVSVNLSARDIQEPDFIRVLEHLLHHYQVPSNRVLLEITETVLLADWHNASKSINDLKALGVKLALDDFGTGYSSLSYLSKIQASTLKVDRSFINSWSESSDDNLLSTMVQLGHGTGMKVVAEGVETIEQLNYLKEIGCDNYQGYLLSKPMSSDDISATEWFKTGRVV